jgi:hypothetical protein
MIAASCAAALSGAPIACCLGALARAAPLAADALTARAAPGTSRRDRLLPPPSPAARRPFSSANGNGKSGKHSAIYITDGNGTTMKNHTPLILGMLNYFERHLPFVGYFTPIGGAPGVGKDLTGPHLRLIQSVFGGDMKCVPC